MDAARDGPGPQSTHARTEKGAERVNVCWRRQAEEALAAREVPVGCVFVRDGTIIARARNRTNELRNVRRTPARLLTRLTKSTT